MNASDVTGSQASSVSGASDGGANRALEDAQAAARAAAEAARKAAEAATAAATERNADKARALREQAASYAQTATTMAAKATNAAKTLNKKDPRVTALVQKATTALASAQGSAAKVKQQWFNPRDVFEPKPKPKPLTPQQKLEVTREQRFVDSDRSARVIGSPVPQFLMPNHLPSPGTPANKKTVAPQLESIKAVEASFEASQTTKASDALLQHGGGKMVNFEAKYEAKDEVAVLVGSDPKAGLISGKAGPKVAVTKTITYELSVPAQLAAQYSGNAKAPNPFDVRTLPVGASMVVKQSEFSLSTAVEGQVSRGLFAVPGMKNGKPEENVVSAGGKLETGGGSSSGTSVSIERLDENIVRLSSGPTQNVKGALSGTAFVEDDHGIAEATAKLEIERSFDTQNLRSIELDMRKPGAQATYDWFLRHGTVPAGGGNAQVGSSETVQTTFKSGGTVELGARFRAAGGSTAFNQEYSIDQKQTFRSDGSVSADFTVADGDRGMQLNRSYKADGTPDLDTSGISYVVRDVPPEVVNRFVESFAPPAGTMGPPAPVTKAESLELTLSPTEALALRDVARAYVKDQEDRYNMSFNSAQQPLIWQLAQADGHEQVATSLIDAGHHDFDSADLSELARFERERSGNQLPGHVARTP